MVANQFKIQDTCAIAFSKHFYQSLGGGLCVEEAVAVGRTAVYNADQNGRDWGAPVLYLRPGDGYLFGGAEVGKIRQGRLAIAVTAETVAGTLIGGQFKVVAGGTITSDVKVGTVPEGGSVTGLKIDDL